MGITKAFWDLSIIHLQIHIWRPWELNHIPSYFCCWHFFHTSMPIWQGKSLQIMIFYVMLREMKRPECTIDDLDVKYSSTCAVPHIFIPSALNESEVRIRNLMMSSNVMKNVCECISNIYHIFIINLWLKVSHKIFVAVDKICSLR